MRWLALACALGCASCGSPHCQPGLSRCAGLCVDTRVSRVNCGACGIACDAGFACASGVCTVPACQNGVLDGTETSVDCGGPDCDPCQVDRQCLTDSDCESGHCRPTKTCAATTCDDQVQDGTETDVDCGQSCPNKCGSGRHCVVDADCAGGKCFADGVCRTQGFLLGADRTNFYAGENAVAHVTATLYADEIPIVGVPVDFNADFGVGIFVDADGGSLGQMTSEVTDSNGNATVTFAPAQTPGVSTVVAYSEGNYASIGLTTVAVAAPVWVSTRCDGGDCPQLGPAGDGYDESALVTFEVLDGQGMPLSGIPIAFSVHPGPAGMSVDPTGVSDTNGLVSTTLRAGTHEGVAYVWATAPGGLAGTSEFVSVIGVKLTNGPYFRVMCTEVTLPAFASVAPPAALTDDCGVAITDRYGNRTTAPVSVHLLSEAGSVPATVTPDGLGAINFTFSTAGALPVDVAPLPALSSNGPFFHRIEEPSTDAGANPRDGLVTIVIYGFGDEYLFDTNGNGSWDPSESFIDQGEPLVDANDDGVWEPGEQFVDANFNGVWDGPNGVWDRNTTVWFDTTLLYWGAGTQLRFGPADFGVCPGGVAKGASSSLGVFVTDDRLNKLFKAANYSAQHTASKGSATSFMGYQNVINDYGFTNEVDVLSPDGGSCGPGPCEAHRYFEYWSDGSAGFVRVDGADPSDMTACENDTLTVSITVNGIPTQFSTTGAIQ